MVGFSSIAEMVNAQNNGQTGFYTWRKTPTQTTIAGYWYDLSMSPGNPVPQYYAASPLISVRLAQSTDGGIFHGNAVSPQSKRLRKLAGMCNIGTAVPMPMILMDYLLYYPFIDEGTIDPQPLTNSVTIPRYTTGAGVQIMAISVAPRTGLQFFTCSYTNQDGVSGRITRSVRQNVGSITGNVCASDIVNQASGTPFLPLQYGDTGVRSIESVTMSGLDVGLFTLVLVKPLAQFMVQGIDAPVEVDYFQNFGGGCPEIKDDAYLGLLCCPNASLLGSPFHGYIEVVWN